MSDCPDCDEFRAIVDPVPAHVHWCHERIRELEAKVACMEKAIEWATMGGWTRVAAAVLRTLSANRTATEER